MYAERKMGSRKKDQTAPHQPLLSSLVVRATDSGGGGGGGGYEADEARRDLPPDLRPNRYNDTGHRRRAGSVSPVRGRDAHFESRNHGVGNGKEASRYHDYSPPYSRGRDEGRILGRNHDQFSRVQPREGDWICSDPYCKYLNFARREQCKNCSKPRYPSFSPRRGYPMPPFAPGRIMNGRFRSPPRGEASRDFSRFPVRGDYLDRYERPMLADWGHRRDTYFEERRDSRRRVLSPPVAAFPCRVRSRSPIRGGGEGSKEYRRDVFMNRRRDDRRGAL